ncbi:hypothetical protein NDU88_000098 [Pleurodeles waltl]|uniref:Uncharacterized protein n=1 Tax=Pleurodeles waltl TaxID=8319 RepID=A0AAV7S3K7_PLEWA|nr:hypothetical protein NDU88_000098 [Pleurodeles waltl]
MLLTGGGIHAPGVALSTCGSLFNRYKSNDITKLPLLVDPGIALLGYVKTVPKASWNLVAWLFYWIKDEWRRAGTAGHLPGRWTCTSTSQSAVDSPIFIALCFPDR